MSEHMMRYVIVPFAMMMLSCVAAMPNPALAGAVAPTRPSGGELAQPATAIVASQQPQSLAYYVAENGSDDNPGTDPATPFRTINKGVTVLSPGDTLYIRGGTYHEKVRVSVSGTAEKPITITAYPGESPVMDGQNTLPGDYGGYLVRLSGSHLILSGLEIRNVAGSAVQSSGDYNTIRRMRIHHCVNGAILVGGTGYCPDGVTNTGNIVEDNEVWMTSLMHEEVMQGGQWDGAINVARCPQDTIVRRNTVHETWGIGIAVHEAYSTTIEDNVVWNNQMEHFYVNNAPYTLVQRNMSYNTLDTPFLYNGMPGHSIAFCDERPTPISHHVTIINNLTWGGARGFIFFSQQPGTGLKYCLIANNTFISSRSEAISIEAGDHQQSRIYNNIFYNLGSVGSFAEHPELDFSHNMWAEAPPPEAVGPGDIIADPVLTQAGPIGPGLLSPDWFKLQATSPAIDAGIALSDVTDDFGRVSRPNGVSHDIGAYESPFSRRVTDLRVIAAVGSSSSVTFTLCWTAPVAAATYTVRSSDTMLTADNWDYGRPVGPPLVASAPGSREWLTASVSYGGGVVYLALKSQNSAGEWSALSNNAFWPAQNVSLPLIGGSHAP